MPSLTTKRPDPGELFIVTVGWSGELPDGSIFAPRVGDVYRRDHPGLAGMLHRDHGVGTYILPAEDATADAMGRARQRSMETDVVEAPDPFVSLPSPTRLERLVVSTTNLFRGDGWLPAGTVMDAKSPFVKANKAFFVPVSAGEG